MKIAFLSDLHLEFWGGEPREILLPAGTDVFVCAGDTATRGHGPERLLDLIEGRWFLAEDGRPFETVFVPGNHDFYGAAYDATRERMRAAAVDGFHVLDERSVEIGGVEFIGATLWTDFGGSEQVKRLSAAMINDFRLIEGFDVERCAAEHRDQVAFLDRALTPGRRDRPRVVVTHFCPTLATDNPRHVASPLKGFFQVDLERLLPAADIWIFGHTHHDADMSIGGCRVLSAQMGYPGEKAWRVGTIEV